MIYVHVPHERYLEKSHEFRHSPPLPPPPPPPSSHPKHGAGKSSRMPWYYQPVQDSTVSYTRRRVLAYAEVQSLVPLALVKHLAVREASFVLDLDVLARCNNLSSSNHTAKTHRKHMRKNQTRYTSCSFRGSSTRATAVRWQAIYGTHSARGKSSLSSVMQKFLIETVRVPYMRRGPSLETNQHYVSRRTCTH